MSEIKGPDGQLYKIAIIATGEVRDKDGNLIESQPIEAEHVVTAEQAEQIAKHIEEEGEDQ